MDIRNPTILVVDDQVMVRAIIRRYLSDTPYQLVEVASAEDALEELTRPYAEFDAVLLDRTMPGMDGIELLRRMKRSRHMAHIPVIIQTTRDSKQEIEEGLEAGAHFYLVKPFDEYVLKGIVATAIEKHNFYKEMLSAARRTSSMMEMLRAGTFRFQSVEQARVLASSLAAGTPEPERVVTGLTELMLNAIEHGNLEIDYDTKTALQENGHWLAEIDRRLDDPKYADRWATIEVETLEDKVVWRIEDAGSGFDWEHYVDPDAERAFDSHGRGIAMSKLMSFDRLEYEGAGNIVVAELDLVPQTAAV